MIAAVNGMACGGAFYMLGEVEFIIAADHATFFDPHVTYGMTAAFEPIHMLQKMPFGGRSCGCRCSGTTSGCRPRERTTSAWSARSCRSTSCGPRPSGRPGPSPRLPPLRSRGGTGHMGRAGAQPPPGGGPGVGVLVAMGTNQDSLAQGQELFRSGKRIEWKLR